MLMIAPLDGRTGFGVESDKNGDLIVVGRCCTQSLVISPKDESYLICLGCGNLHHRPEGADWLPAYVISTANRYGVLEGLLITNVTSWIAYWTGIDKELIKVAWRDE